MLTKSRLKLEHPSYFGDVYLQDRSEKGGGRQRDGKVSWSKVEGEAEGGLVWHGLLLISHCC